MKRVIVLQHVACEELGLLAAVLAEAQVDYRYVRGYAGEPVPETLDGASGLIVLGGPMGVRDVDTLPYLADELALIERTLAAGLPILGICLGSQLLALALGSQVGRGRRPEIGWHPITLTAAAADDPLCHGIASAASVISLARRQLRSAARRSPAGPLQPTRPARFSALATGSMGCFAIWKRPPRASAD